MTVTSNPAIVFCADRHYLPYVGVTAHSLLAANPALKPAFHIITDRRPDDDNGRRFEQLARRHGVLFHVHAISPREREELSSIATAGHFTVANYFRLLIPQALPAALDQVLYLDADMVVQGDLSPLLATDVSGVTLAACPDPLGRRVTGRADYFNTGTLLINLRLWRERKVSALALAYARRYNPPFCDQDALNAVIPVADRRELGAEYNCMIYDRLKPELRGDVDAMFAAVCEPRILHFTGAIKPWHDWFSGSHRDRFLRALGESPWHDMSDVLKHNPATPQQAFWLGEVAEAAGDTALAAAQYKRAAQDLLK